MSSNIEVKLDVLNQKASPALYAAPLADRPAASFTGRLFVDSDSPSTGLYRDTGSAWIQIADAGAGTTGTLQQVTTNGNTTSIGISVTANGIGIGTTIPATNRLDIHSATGLQATFNGTGTTNSALQLQSAGVGKWNVTNKYNSAANDFAITDVLNTLDRLTIKNTGQTFIGTSTTSSGLLVVNSATSDNHFVALGANAPSLRLRNAGTGATLDAGLGISTATNNFIQGSASGQFCIFNSSTTASPILFGVYDGSTATQEAARISAARNFLVGGTSDSGQKLQITGTALISLDATINTLTIGLGNNNNGTNTAIGFQTLYTNTTGQRNVALGYKALNPNTTGSYNTALGFASMISNLTGNSNIAIGVSALRVSTTTNQNSTVGYESLYWLTSGDNNVGLGIAAGKNFTGNLPLTTSTGGIFIGSFSYALADSTTNEIVIGAAQIGKGSNTAIIGSTSNTAVYLVGKANISNAPVYASNALAIAGGLAVGDLYKSAVGVLSIVY